MLKATTATWLICATLLCAGPPVRFDPPAVRSPVSYGPTREVDTISFGITSRDLAPVARAAEVSAPRPFQPSLSPIGAQTAAGEWLRSLDSTRTVRTGTSVRAATRESTNCTAFG